MQEFKVLVRCFTYNHSNYIQDTMNGFIIQETDFPYVCAIVDDCSKDNEDVVIEDYLKENFYLGDSAETENTNDYRFIYTQHKKNKNCYFAVFLLKYNHQSVGKLKNTYLNRWISKVKYISICEGDDYWIDPYKLQKETDVLDGNNKVMLVHTGFDTVDSVGNKIYIPLYERHKKVSKSGFVLPRLLKNNYIMTLTIMFRKDFEENSLLKNIPIDYDYSRFLCAAAIGEFEYISDITGCYRITTTGAVSTRNNDIQKWRHVVTRYIAEEFCNGNIKIPKQRKVFLISLLLNAIDSQYSLYSLLKKNKQLIVLLPFAFFVKLLDSILYRCKKKYDAYSLLFGL